MSNFPPKQVYLAGTITSLTHDQARYGWRKEFAPMLLPHIHVYSPMRAKEFLAPVGVLESDDRTYPKNALSTDAGIVTRDRNDVRNCDAMVACFNDARDFPSLGTAVEFGWADAFGKPVILIAEPDDIHARHAMLKRIAGYIVPTLPEAAHVVNHLLTPGL